MVNLYSKQNCICLEASSTRIKTWDWLPSEICLQVCHSQQHSDADGYFKSVTLS